MNPKDLVNRAGERVLNLLTPEDKDSMNAYIIQRERAMLSKLVFTGWMATVIGAGLLFGAAWGFIDWLSYDYEIKQYVAEATAPFEEEIEDNKERILELKKENEKLRTECIERFVKDLPTEEEL